MIENIDPMGTQYSENNGRESTIDEVKYIFIFFII